MNPYRYRLIFAKRGDLRWISHRDLLRTLERALRRAGLRLAMSQGFHPKPRLSFPLALALGIESTAEVMDLALTESIPADEVRARLQDQLPAGLSVQSIQLLGGQERKFAAARVRYRIVVPTACQPGLPEACRRLWSQSHCPVSKAGRDQPVDVRPGLTELLWDGTYLWVAQELTDSAAVGPREILAALDLNDLEQTGGTITRVAMESVT